ncbi:MAG: hypothetical protein U9Q61_08010 [Thermodesulfobacteriota bacterium]|nr:hypothetical protein [Thermodesulfobacteriota bacterium]
MKVKLYDAFAKTHGMTSQKDFLRRHQNMFELEPSIDGSRLPTSPWFGNGVLILFLVVYCFAKEIDSHNDGSHNDK